MTFYLFKKIRFSKDLIFHENSIIIDDNLNAWENCFRENMILSKKYLGFFINEFFDDQQHKYLELLSGGSYRYCYMTDRLGSFELREIYHKFIDDLNCPFSIEYNYSKNFQMKFLTDVLLNVFKLSFLKDCMVL